MLKLLALFIVLPLLDLWLLSTLAGDSFLGFGFAIGLVISTGLIGASLAKRQGLTAWQNFNSELGQAELPLPIEVTKSGGFSFAFLITVGVALLAALFWTSRLLRRRLKGRR